MITYDIQPYQLRFRFPFRLAHTTREYTDNAYLTLSCNGVEALGEAVYPPYYPETPASLELLMSKVNLPEQLPDSLPDFLHAQASLFPDLPFSRAALDMALHNLQAAHTGISIRKRYGIPEEDKASSLTIGMSSDEEMKEKIAYGEEQGFTYFKLKVNQEEIERIVNTYRACTSLPFVVDANQGFDDREVALYWANQLLKYDVAYIEQPFDKHDMASHAWLKARTGLPVIADESFQQYHELSSITKNFDGINVKLMKSGGILPAWETLNAAREKGLKTVLGCMADSSVGIRAANHLAPLADWADLDGTYLITNDPYRPKTHN